MLIMATSLIENAYFENVMHALIGCTCLKTMKHVIKEVCRDVVTLSDIEYDSDYLVST